MTRNNNKLTDLKIERNFLLFTGNQLKKRCHLFEQAGAGEISMVNMDDEATWLHRYYQINGTDATRYLPEKVVKNLKKDVGSAKLTGRFDLKVITWNKADPYVSKHDSGLFPSFDGMLEISIYGDKCKFQLPVGIEIDDEEYWTWCNCKYDDKQFIKLLELIDEELKETVKWALGYINKLSS